MKHGGMDLRILKGAATSSQEAPTPQHPLTLHASLPPLQEQEALINYTPLVPAKRKGRAAGERYRKGGREAKDSTRPHPPPPPPHFLPLLVKEAPRKPSHHPPLPTAGLPSAPTLPRGEGGKGQAPRGAALFVSANNPPAFIPPPREVRGELLDGSCGFKGVDGRLGAPGRWRAPTRTDGGFCRWSGFLLSQKVESTRTSFVLHRKIKERKERVAWGETAHPKRA